MPIKFNCPHCNKEFNVKDQLAGKRAGCPACRKLLTVPAPTSAPANVEEFAAAALAEQTEAVAPQKEPEAVEFVCSYCETKVQVAAEFAGKQTSCPECRRIVKVPLPVKAGPKDWRNVNARIPSGARLDTEPAPEGAWDARAVGAVSREALLEADAVPQKKTKRTWQQRTRVGVYAGALVVVVAILVFAVLNYRAQTLQTRTLENALAGIEDLKEKRPEISAELHRAAGEYYLNTTPPQLAEAKVEFQKSLRDALAITSSALVNERECLLTDLLLSLTDLGGTKAEADERRRLKWDSKLQGQFRLVWQGLHAPEARAQALVLFTRKLAEKGKGDEDSRQFLAQLPELLSLFALEKLRSGKDSEKAKAEALLLAENASQPFRNPPTVKPDPQKKKPLPPSALIALWIALGKDDQAIALSGPLTKDKPFEPQILAGFAEGRARLGQWTNVNTELAGIPLSERLPALVAVAAAAVEREPADTASGEHYLNEAFQAASTHPKLPEVSPWLLYRLVRLGGHANMAEKAVALAKQIPAPDLRGRAQLEVLSARLAKTKDVADAGVLEIVDKDTPAHFLALEIWARHNARSIGAGVLKSVATWPEADCRFGHIGMVLGLQDSARK